MSRGIAGLPLELLINVVSHLNLEDFVNLKMASSKIYPLLDNESLSRELVKVSSPSLSFFTITITITISILISI